MERQVDARRLASTLLAVTATVQFVPMVIAAQRETASPGWWELVVGAGVVGAIALAGARQPEWSARVLWVTYVGSALTFPLVRLAPLGDLLWSGHVVYVTATACCLLHRSHIVAVAGLAVLLGAQGMLVLSEVNPVATAFDMAFAATMGAIGFAIWSVMRAAQDRITEALTRASDALVRARAGEAHADAARLWDSYVHDDVLAVLADVVRAEEADSRRVRELAGQVAERARSLGTAVPVPDLVDGLIGVVLEIDPRVDTILEPPAQEPPDAVREALLDAVKEALRNVVQHAWPEGRPGEAAVAMRPVGGGVEVVVADDGVGFDTGGVPPARLGIQLSILDRLAAVGGRAEVHSVPGQGTRVTLRWPGAA